MRGYNRPQFMDHMRSVSRAWLQILSLASEVDRLKKSSGNKYALWISKKIQLVMHGPPLVVLHCGVYEVSSYTTGIV